MNKASLKNMKICDYNAYFRKHLFRIYFENCIPCCVNIFPKLLFFFMSLIVLTSHPPLVPPGRKAILGSDVSLYG